MRVHGRKSNTTKGAHSEIAGLALLASPPRARRPSCMSDADLMSFDEIGKALGMSAKMAKYYHDRAIVKLLRKPNTLQRLFELADMRQRIRRGQL
jgi:DNA-directed RNA polymerase specialized sigma24 family protein